eukprot:6352336-Heterocapsa_arctica.AAC.1
MKHSHGTANVFAKVAHASNERPGTANMDARMRSKSKRKGERGDRRRRGRQIKTVLVLLGYSLPAIADVPRQRDYHPPR